MMTTALILLGAFLGAVTTFVVCSRNYAASLRSMAAAVERMAYARGYEDGSLPGQRKVLKAGALARDKGTLLASEIEPAVLKRLALKWLQQGRRCQCHAWLALAPVMMTDDEAWLSIPFVWRVVIFALVVFVTASVCAGLLMRGAIEESEELARKINARRDERRQP